MSKIALGALVAAVLLFSVPAFAVDGVVLINQAAVTAAGGFPYQITQPGSYKLSGNLSVAATDGIQINADNVTLDLNGFSISGPISCTGTPVTSCSLLGTLGAGIHISGTSVTVRNGSVRGMNWGVLSAGEATLVEEVQASQNVNAGISILTGIVRHGVTSSNGYGISIAGGIVEGNVTEYNEFEGIVVGFDRTTTSDGVTILGNSVIRNGSFGLEAQYCLYGSNIFKLNGLGSVVVTPGGDVTSQGNNSCDGKAC